MSGLVGGLKRALSLGGSKKDVDISNWSFKLGTIGTVAMLTVATLAASSTQYFGAPIKCDAGKVMTAIFIYIVLLTSTISLSCVMVSMLKSAAKHI